MEIAMIKEQIAGCLAAYGYRMLSGTAENIAVGCKDENGVRKAVCFINLKDGALLYKEHYIRLRTELFRAITQPQMSGALQEDSEVPVQLLMLFYTDYIDTAKRLAEEEDYFWIIDARQKRLMVYEPEQTMWVTRGAFDELIHPLENCIQQVPQKKVPKKHITEYFLATYILIAVNLFVFFVLEQGIFRGRSPRRCYSRTRYQARQI